MVQASMVKLTDVDWKKFPTVPSVCGPETASDGQQRLGEPEGVQQDGSICSARDNVPRLPALKGWGRAGNQNNHQSSQMI